MKKISIKRVNSILVIAIIFTLLVGTLAFFTDHAQGNATATTSGGIVIVTDPDDPTYEDKLQAKWAAVNAGPFKIFNPGDTADLSFVLANEGQMAVNVRETFVIKSNKVLSSTPEFQLVSVVAKDSNGAATGGTAVVTQTKVNDYTYRYDIAPYVLSGSNETISSNPTKLDRDYYLIFNAAADNDFQGATCEVYYLAEAKQYSSSASDWDIAEEGTLSLGGISVPVVPAA